LTQKTNNSDESIEKRSFYGASSSSMISPSIGSRKPSYGKIGREIFVKNYLCQTS